MVCSEARVNTLLYKYDVSHTGLVCSRYIYGSNINYILFKYFTVAIQIHG